MVDIPYHFDEGYSKERHEYLHKRLKQYNEQQISLYQKQDFLFSYQNREGDIIAGLYAYLKLGMFYIDLLWVDDVYRNQGLGAALLKKAEKVAEEHDALYIRVNTGSFQAPAFYLKNGFQQLAKLPITTARREQQFDYYFIKYISGKCLCQI